MTSNLYFKVVKLVVLGLVLKKKKNKGGCSKRG